MVRFMALSTHHWWKHRALEQWLLLEVFNGNVFRTRSPLKRSWFITTRSSFRLWIFRRIFVPTVRKNSQSVLVCGCSKLRICKSRIKDTDLDLWCNWCLPCLCFKLAHGQREKDVALGHIRTFTTVICKRDPPGWNRTSAFFSSFSFLTKSALQHTRGALGAKHTTAASNRPDYRLVQQKPQNGQVHRVYQQKWFYRINPVSMQYDPCLTIRQKHW